MHYLLIKTSFYIASVIRPQLDEHFPESMGVKIIAEPGRFFSASPVSVIINIIAATKVKASRIYENGIYAVYRNENLL